MAALRSNALAIADSGDVSTSSEAPSSIGAEDRSGRDRRAFARFDPVELSDPMIARIKYGDTLTLLDVSAGGALVETSAALRPESTLVLEVMGAGSQEAVSVVARVVRCQVSGVRGGVRYRGACAFKRPLDYPVLLAPPTPRADATAANFLKTEFALKTIVEGYRRKAKGPRAAIVPDASALLESLGKLRDAAEQRIDPIDQRVAQMLAALLPTLHSNVAADDVMAEVLLQLQRHIPALVIRVGSGARAAGASDVERFTMNVWQEPAQRATLTAEFPTGFDIDETQFRLMRAGAYLMGLAESWTPAVPVEQAPPPAVEPSAPEAEDDKPVDLPVGWQRIVIRFVDGKLLRGYSNNFHPDAAHLHLSPGLNTIDGERLMVPIARLKAVFFVRDLEGNADHVDSNNFDHTPRGRKVEVTFRDGEVMIGSTLSYKPHGQGFYLTPANSHGNNQRVYVVLAAVRHIRFI